MTRDNVIPPVRKTVRVNAPIAHAFDVFTSGITRWWPKNMGVGKMPVEKVVIEPRLGGRWLEIAGDGTQTIVATITHWEPPHRVVLVWQVNASWQPDASMKSEVDVRFAPDGSATQIDLLHHKFETMGAVDGASMRRDVDGGWPGLLERFVAEAEVSGGGARP